MDEVCPRPGENKVSTWCFDIGIGITGLDVVVGCVVTGIVTHNEVATCIDVYSTVVLGTHVAVDPIDPACGVHASAVTAARTITLASVTFHASKVIHLDAIASVTRCRATGHRAADRGDNPDTAIPARVAVTHRAGAADRDPAAAILLPRGTSNKGPFRARYAKARIEMRITVDHR